MTKEVKKQFIKWWNQWGDRMSPKFSKQGNAEYGFYAGYRARDEFIANEKDEEEAVDERD